MSDNNDEYSIVLQNLEKLRLFFNIEMQEIDESVELGKNTYSRIISGKQSIKLNELISIGRKIYNLKAIQILNPNLKIPSIQSLPKIVRDIVKERKGKVPRTQEKRDITHYCIVILNKYLKVGDHFTNSQVKQHFKGELETAFKRKSIEWNKSILSPFVEDTGKTQKVKTKPEKVYRLIKKIPSDMVKKAKDTVGADWLHESGEKD